MHKRYKGYTMFEILVVIGILLLIATFAVPFSLRQTKRNELLSTVRELESNLFYQQQIAYIGKNGSSKSVEFTNTGYWLYEGDNLSRDFFPFPTNTYLSTNNNVVTFPSQSLTPNLPTNITLTNGTESATITINSEGMIDYTI